MGKSIRSKVKKQFRTIKRELVAPHVEEQIKIASEDLPVGARPEETPESFARRHDPRRKDKRMGCAAFTLAFPGGVTGDDKRRGGVGNPGSIIPEELSKMRAIEKGTMDLIQLEEEEAEREKALEEKDARMEVEGPKKTIKKKKRRSKSETSWGRSN